MTELSADLLAKSALIPESTLPGAFAPHVAIHERPPSLEISSEAVAQLVEGATDTRPVNGLTHNHYKYPARFSPALARAAIDVFSEPGDLILDPFVGGGTTMVEALASGRDVVGVDISSLAVFVAEAKCLRLAELDIIAFEAWVEKLSSVINIHAAAAPAAGWDVAGYFRNIETRAFWRLRKAIGQVLASVTDLPLAAETLARCTVLRASHWAFDARKNPPQIVEFKRNLIASAIAMLADARRFGQAFEAGAARIGRYPRMAFLERSSAGLETDVRLAALPPPRLVLTSPPYPGVHVLYHRWQVDGCWSRRLEGTCTSSRAENV